MHKRLKENSQDTQIKHLLIQTARVKDAILFSPYIVSAHSLATLLREIYINFVHFVLGKWPLAIIFKVAAIKKFNQ